MRESPSHLIIKKQVRRSCIQANFSLFHKKLPRMKSRGYWSKGCKRASKRRNPSFLRHLPVDQTEAAKSEPSRFQLHFRATGQTHKLKFWVVGCAAIGQEVGVSGSLEETNRCAWPGCSHWLPNWNVLQESLGAHVRWVLLASASHFTTFQEPTSVTRENRAVHAKQECRLIKYY